MAETITQFGATPEVGVWPCQALWHLRTAAPVLGRSPRCVTYRPPQRTDPELLSERILAVTQSPSLGQHPLQTVR